MFGIRIVAAVCTLVGSAALAQQPTFFLLATSKNTVAIPATSSLSAVAGDVIGVDAFVRDWSASGQPLKGYQWSLDHSSFFSGDAGNVLPRIFALTTDISGHCSSSGPIGTENTGNAFIDATRTDFVHAGPERYYSVDTISCGHRYGSVVPGTGPMSATGVRKYAGSVLLQVSNDAAGRFVVSFDAGAKATFLRRAHNSPILPLMLEGLTIDVPSGELRIVSSDPRNNSIDARQNSDISGANPAGYRSIVLQFDGPTGNVTASDFTVTVDPVGAAPAIQSVVPSGNSVTIQFATIIPVGKWTKVQYNGEGAPSSVRVGFLPSDVNNDGSCGGLDIIRLIDALNNVVILPDSQKDINRSGLATPQDILTVIDLLNGAGDFIPWNGMSLPP